MSIDNEPILRLAFYTNGEKCFPLKEFTFVHTWAVPNQRNAYEEEMIAKLKVMFQCYEHHYNANPTFEQVRAVAKEVKLSAKYDFDSLYKVLASGNVPPEIDTIITKHAQGWPPPGNVIDADVFLPSRLTAKAKSLEVQEEGNGS